MGGGNGDYQSLVFIIRTGSYSGNLWSDQSILGGGTIGFGLEFNSISLGILLKRDCTGAWEIGQLRNYYDSTAMR